MFKNVAGQKWIVFAFQGEGGANPGNPVTGDSANITGNLRLDGGAADAIDDTNPAELEDGYYVFDITQAESNGNNILIAPESSTANVIVIGAPGALYTTDVVETAKAVWDRILTGATHGIPTSAGRRLRALNDFGPYEGGLVWINTITGTPGTVDFENGTVNLPSLTLADASTIRASIPLPGFHVVPGSTITLAATYNNVEFDGVGYTLLLGGRDIDNSHIFNAKLITGIATAANSMSFYNSIFGTASIQKATSTRCAYTETITMALAGAYRYYDCKSGVAGASSPIFTKTPGQTITAEWRNWSNGITVSGLEAGDVITISGRLGTVTLNGADANVEIRGSYKAIVNNLTGSQNVNTDGAWKGADIAAIKADTVIPARNAIFSDIPVLMVAASDHVTPTPGLTVAVNRSLDGAAFEAVTGSIAEVGNGLYSFDASAADMDADKVTFRFSAATADDTFLTLVTR